MIGTTTFNWLRPMPGAVMTTAGRVFLISSPVVGSKSTHQISPRCGMIVGVDGLFDKICLTEGFKYFEILVLCGLYRLCKQALALLER